MAWIGQKVGKKGADWFCCPPSMWAIRATKLHQSCVLCWHLLADGDEILCQTCLQSVPKRPPVAILTAEQMPMALRLYAASYYQYPVNRLLLQLKDHQSGEALLALVRLLKTLPKPKQCNADNTVIIPTPTTVTRLKNRGHNPVLTLAKHLSSHWHLPIWQGLVRHDDEQHQRGLGKHERLQNTQHKFRLQSPLPCRQVILFDDVATTGATLQAMAAAILANNPNVRILAVCVAHGSQAH